MVVEYQLYRVCKICWVKGVCVCMGEKNSKVGRESKVGGTFIEYLESLRQVFRCRSLNRISNDPDTTV